MTLDELQVWRMDVAKAREQVGDDPHKLIPQIIENVLDWAKRTDREVQE